MAKSKLTDQIRDEAAALERIRKGEKGARSAAEQIRAIHDFSKRVRKPKS